jgi:MYXO-CTERM domain-containing protein
MFAEHNALGIEIEGCFKGYAEGPLGVAALLVIVLVLIAIWRRRNR